MKMALSNGPDKPFTAQDVVQRAYNNGMAASGFGTGGKYQQAIQAATAAVQGLAGGNLSAAPYIAEIIKQTTPDGAGRVAAHAVVNAALSLECSCRCRRCSHRRGGGNDSHRCVLS